MKKIIYVIAVFTLSVILSSCRKTGKGNSSNESQRIDTLHKGVHESESIEVFIVDTLSGDTDTVHVTPDNKVISLPVDQKEKAKAKAAERKKAQIKKGANKTPAKTNATSKQTPDQSLFDVKGPVKTINYTQGFVASYNQIVYIDESRDLVNFTSDGKWQPSSRYSVSRDAKGRITNVVRLQDKIVNEYTWNGSTINTIKVYSQSKKNVSSTAKLTRDQNNLVNGYTAIIVFPGNNGKENVQVKILSKDKHGNWTRRRFRTRQETRIEERVIEYR